MTTWSEAKGRKVVSIESAATVGRVSDLVLDPSHRRVAALVLSKTPGKCDILPWASVTAFGQDAVTVGSESLIVAADDRIAELAAKPHAAQGKRVLTSAGEILGEVKDLDFDPDTGTISSLILKDGEVTADHLIAIGSYAVIIKA